MVTKKVQGSEREKLEIKFFFKEMGRKELSREKNTRRLTLGPRRADRKPNTQTHWREWHRVFTGASPYRTAHISSIWFRNIVVIHQETPNTEYPNYKSQEMARLRKEEEHAHRTDIQGSDISQYSN